MLYLHFAALLVLLFVAALPAGPLRPVALSASQTTLQTQIDLIQTRISTIRGLQVVDEIPRNLMTRDELRAYLETSFLEDVTPEEIESATHRWEILGYIPPGMDLVKLYLDVYTEQVLGFYTLDKKMLFLISERESLNVSDQLTMAHELTHALQDQHFNLKDKFDALKLENDAIMAMQALAEGDAELSKELYGRQHLTTAQRMEAFQFEVSGGSSAIERAPLVVRRELFFPYTSGVEFVAERWTNGGWAAVNQVWENPPQSTEQILHPQKYVQGEGPIYLTVPDLGADLGGGQWRELEENTNGELDWNILVEQYVDAGTANEAATGWGGDRFRLYKRDADGALAFVAKTAWDSDLDARQFFQSMQAVVSRRHGASLQLAPQRTVRSASEAAQAPELWEATAAQYSYSLELQGSRMNLVISTGPNAAGIVDRMGPP
jgi:hypothetical protein